MAIYRAQIGFALDTDFARDIVTINPHFNGDNAQALADALKANLLANAQIGATSPFTVKIYDAQKPPPSYPLAQAASGTGHKTTSWPRELGLCLSYYATWNRPSYRGRLYIPGTFLGGTPGLRPSGTQQTNALAWRTIFTTGLPAQTVFSVYSRKLNQASGVSAFWVDDEWDVVRSRGMRGQTRMTA